MKKQKWSRTSWKIAAHHTRHPAIFHAERKKSMLWQLLRWLVLAISLFLCVSAIGPFVTMRIFSYGSAAILAVAVPALLLSLFPRAAVRLKDVLHASRGGRVFLRAAAVVLGCAALYVAAVTGTMIDACVRTAPRNPDPTLIVLGCQVYESGPSPVLEQRLKAALDYLNDRPDAMCVVSGGQGRGEHASEASVMKAWLVARGVNASRILAEEQSTNTEENIRFSMQLLRESGRAADAVTVATDWWHELRARVWVERADAVFYAQPCATYWPVTVVYYARELCGVVRLLVAGY